MLFIPCGPYNYINVTCDKKKSKLCIEYIYFTGEKNHRWGSLLFLYYIACRVQQVT